MQPPPHDDVLHTPPCWSEKSHEERSETPREEYAARTDVTVVGIYGIPGSGKTYLLNQLKQNLQGDNFAFYEGSEVIASVVPGGLKTFQELPEHEQSPLRELAIDAVGRNCAKDGRTAVVTGHFMFWNEDQESGSPVCTENDLRTYTHILYLDVPAEIVERHCRNDTERRRPLTSATHLRKWQLEEQTQLRHLCRQRGILFSTIASHDRLPENVSTLLVDFRSHTEARNMAQAKAKLDQVLLEMDGPVETMLILDGDRTLAPEDTGVLFWEKALQSSPTQDGNEPLKTLFSGPLGYSYTAFRQAVLLYEATADEETFDTLCQGVSSAVNMHSEFVSLLQTIAEQNHVGATVITCGLRRVWEKVLEKEGLSEKVKVIGGGRIADGFVVSPTVKGALVVHLQETHHIYTWAFGDSPMDLDMLRQADQAIVVVGEEQKRSKTMDSALAELVDTEAFAARQTLLPSSVSARLDLANLPIVKLTDREFLESLLRGQHIPGGLHFLCDAESNATKLLATPMRDAAIAGPHLREAHRKCGWYLAVNTITNVVGIEDSPVRHVLGHEASGCRLRHERQTTIVALMRGGEPMALGVSDAFPVAMLVHARVARDIKLHHLDGQLTVILVDSVINTGNSIIEFVSAVRHLHATIRIVIVAGVVQAQCISEGTLERAFVHQPNIHLITLRTSDTKFTGSGTTDTGNRLFNTTHLL